MQERRQEGQSSGVRGLSRRVVAHLRRIARSKLYRWRNRSKHASCITTDLENDNVMRTKRASRCESRVIPALHVSGFSRLFPTAVRCSGIG